MTLREQSPSVRPTIPDNAGRSIEDCRKDFPALVREVRVAEAAGTPVPARLDGPAGSQVPAAVIEAQAEAYRSANANTHGHFAASVAAGRLIDGVRETVAAFLGAPGPETISFGQSMTTLTFSLAHALGRSFEAGDEIVVTQLDHEANRGPWLMLRERGMVVREVALRPDGRLDLDDLAAQVGGKAKLVAMGWSSNALGTVNDVARAREMSRDVGALLVVDAVHHAPHFAIDVAVLEPDFLLCSAYKFYGPHVGLLYSRPGLLDRLETDRLSTAGQEAPERIETGTLGFAALAGVRAAIEYLASWGAGETLRERIIAAMDRIGAHEHALARRYAAGLAAIPGATLRGPEVPAERGSFPRAPTVSITLDGTSAADAARFLGERGIAVWDGHFYARRAMEVLGLLEAGGVLRTGVLMYNTAVEVDRLLEGLDELARRG